MRNVEVHILLRMLSFCFSEPSYKFLTFTTDRCCLLSPRKAVHFEGCLCSCSCLLSLRKVTVHHLLRAESLCSTSLGKAVANLLWKKLSTFCLGCLCSSSHVHFLEGKLQLTFAEGSCRPATLKSCCWPAQWKVVHFLLGHFCSAFIQALDTKTT